ncbi:MAG: 50S ribosomal protein L9, partial [Moorea sp. SIO3C2]|nr:50S ribosomal protein L9 [Moorena sp. SIO3C2]
MVKRVQVVLSKDVQKLGKDGDLVEVAPGYARNYLIPQGIAVRATSGVLKQVERRREQERQRILEIK